MWRWCLLLTLLKIKQTRALLKEAEEAAVQGGNPAFQARLAQTVLLYVECEHVVRFTIRECGPSGVVG